MEAASLGEAFWICAKRELEEQVLKQGMRAARMCLLLHCWEVAAKSLWLSATDLTYIANTNNQIVSKEGC